MFEKRLNPPTKIFNGEKDMYRKIFFGVIFALIPFLISCSSVQIHDIEQDPIQIECDPTLECNIDTNILVCDKDNQHCEYIDWPLWYFELFESLYFYSRIA